jgi:hypothetical protein
VKIEVFWPSVDRKDISEYVWLQWTGFEFGSNLTILQVWHGRGEGECF